MTAHLDEEGGWPPQSRANKTPKNVASSDAHGGEEIQDGKPQSLLCRGRNIINEGTCRQQHIVKGRHDDTSLKHVSRAMQCVSKLHAQGGALEVLRVSSGRAAASPVKLMMEASPTPMAMRHNIRVQKLMANPQPMLASVQMSNPQPAGTGSPRQPRKQVQARGAESMRHALRPQARAHQ